MPRETNTEEESEGVRWLNLLGWKHLVGKPSPRKGVNFEDFLSICGDDAIDTLDGLEEVYELRGRDPEDPYFIEARDSVRAMVREHVGRIPEPDE